MKKPIRGFAAILMLCSACPNEPAPPPPPLDLPTARDSGPLATIVAVAPWDGARVGRDVAFGVIVDVDGQPAAGRDPIRVSLHVDDQGPLGCRPTPGASSQLSAAVTEPVWTCHAPPTLTRGAHTATFRVFAEASTAPLAEATSSFDYNPAPAAVTYTAASVGDGLRIRWYADSPEAVEAVLRAGTATVTTQRGQAAEIIVDDTVTADLSLEVIDAWGNRSTWRLR